MPAGGGGGEQFWIATGPQSPIPWITTTRPAQANYLLGPFTTVKAAVAAARKAGYPKVALPKASTRQPGPDPGPGAGPGTSKPPKGGGAEGGKTRLQVPYTNPFRNATITPGRIDQGVDFSGTGPIGAIGRAKVLYAGYDPGGWGPAAGGVAPGGFIRYQLLEGPAAGKQVYVAEGVQPSVSVGQEVQPGQTIGQMVGPIETGWASGAGTQPLSQTAQAGGISGSGPFPTKVGQNFDKLLIGLGVAPSADVGGQGSGTLPSWLTWIENIFSGITGNPGGTAASAAGATGGLAAIGHWLGTFVTDITDIHMWISLGWMALGLLLVIIGISWLLRIPDRFKGFTSDVRAQVASAL